MKESDLYAPVKTLLEDRGYTVKGEVNGCDVVASKTGAPPVIVELKLAFSLDLVLQGIERQSVSDDVYIAICGPDTPTKRKNWRSRQRGYKKLCRMLGLGLILIKPDMKTDILLDPAPYEPRKNKRKQTRLMTEFIAREGDPNTGGVNRIKIITSYRQDALRCAVALSTVKEMKASKLRDATGVQKAASILLNNHYNWFDRTARGIYCLSPVGHEGLETFAGVIASLDSRNEDTHDA